MKSVFVVLRKKFAVVFVKNGFMNFSFVLMGTPSAIHIITAVLAIEDTDPSRGSKALAVVTACGTSTFVVIPIGTITSLLALITAFNSATGAVKKAKWLLIKAGLKAMMRIFQTQMDNVPADAEACCLSGGFKVKKVAIKQEQVFSISQGTLSGTIDCIGNTSKKDHCHDWLLGQAGSPMVRMRPTPASKKQFTGLAPGTWIVQHQLILANGDDGPFETLTIDLI